jgi:hypothetical protein
MTIKDPELRAHQEWLGYVQPVGLVVSAHALHRAQAFVAKGILPEHARFLTLVKEVPVAGKDEPIRAVTDLDALVTTVFGWESRDLVGALGGEPLPDDLKVPLNEYGETLSPTYAVADPEPQGEGTARWQMLIQKLELAKPLDEPLTNDDLRWQASPQARLERLLRETGVSAGLLTNGIEFRLVYAPRGESSGHATFRVDQMCEIAGRPIFAAMQMLLGAERLFTLPRKQRLPHILSESRKYQNEVSTALAEQVLHALYEMLRGFQKANEESKGELLRDVLREDPNHVYNGLLTVLLRLIFVLYAEERGLISSDPVYVNHYSVLGLFERLRADNDRNQDTMDHRYGAWAQLLTLFRLIHDGGSHGSLRLPPRHGHLFNPDRFNFLEGRPWHIGRVMGDRIEPPAISDGVIHRVLSKLLLLDGERISYRSLDVEQIGSVYEVMMGFTLDIASGTSIAIKPKKPLGAPTIVNLEELLAVTAKGRAKWLSERTDQEFTGKASAALLNAATTEDLAASVAMRVAREATPTPLPKGSMILQSSEARRRSGSNYTPRSLTEPIVRKTLMPILRDLKEAPTPEQILTLKVCDPAMGSGAFLVETCRQLGDALVKSWHAHAQLPHIPHDEDELLHARRLVAQRCLYGVDKNPIAADLAKLSLWLATLAKDHPFTFLDHALRCGDSLVGLTRANIEGFHWQPSKQLELVHLTIAARIKQALELRAKIHTGGDDLGYDERRLLLKDADEALDDVRLVGDLAVCAFFEGESARARELIRVDLAARIDAFLKARENFNELRSRTELLRSGPMGVPPFHWEVEFPEVFDRRNPGFDAVVGNPPFAGSVQLGAASGVAYTNYLRTQYLPASGKTDLVAYFFRKAFALLRLHGAFGLIGTKTVGQGDTRETGLSYICDHGGVIYDVVKRIRWPGTASVIVSTLHVSHGDPQMVCRIDGHEAPRVTAFLFYAGGNHEPTPLLQCPAVSSKGVVPYGMGFVFEDGRGECSPLSELEAIRRSRGTLPDVVHRFLGGDDLNNTPNQTPDRFIIDFGDADEQTARKWNDLFAIVEARVKPGRMALTTQAGAEQLKRYFWRFGYQAKELRSALLTLDSAFVMSQTSKWHAVALCPARWTFDQKVVVFAREDWPFFSVLQSRIHEVWALFFGSTLGDTPVYTPSDCFETFPFPRGFEANLELDSAGKRYYEYRAELMIGKREGLTRTYNRFHDPSESSADIVKLRELHSAMDRAVLTAYGLPMRDIPTDCAFIPDSIGEDDDGNEIQKSYRYRWPDVVRDEVLARLLAMNADRAEEERVLAVTAEPAPKVRRPAKKKGADSSTPFFPD